MHGYGVCSSKSSFDLRKLVIARYHSKLPSRCPGSTFPKEKLRVVPLASVVWTKVSRSCFTVREASLTSKLAITTFSFSRLSKKTVGKTLEMILPDAELNRLSLSGSNQANSRATNLDLLSHIASPFELCFSKLYRSQKSNQLWVLNNGRLWALLRAFSWHFG